MLCCMHKNAFIKLISIQNSRSNAKKMKNRDLCTQKKNETRFCMHTRVAEIFTRKSLQNEFMTNDSFMRCDFSFYSVKIRNGLFSRLYFGMCDMCCHVFIKINAKKKSPFFGRFVSIHIQILSR